MSKPLSRRAFLHSSALATVSGTLQAATAVVPTAPVEEAGRSPEQGPGPVPVSLTLNGSPCVLDVEPRTTLAEALRGSGLTGTKIACDRGACAACTVWLDGSPVSACMLLALDAAGRSVTTIEGLAHGDELHPVQAAFIEHDAVQCGFCTPGMIMSCAALLAHHPNPAREEVTGAISGHLCRCGTYPHVIAATLAAAARRS